MDIAASLVLRRLQCSRQSQRADVSRTQQSVMALLLLAYGMAPCDASGSQFSGDGRVGATHLRVQRAWSVECGSGFKLRLHHTV